MKNTALTIPSGSPGRRLLGLLFCALFGAGCATGSQTRVILPQSPAASPAVSEINTALSSAALQTSAASADYRLGAEDLLEIIIFNVPEGFGASPGGTGPIARRMEVRVSQEGMIALPLLGNIPAAGSTTAALEQSLRKRYDEFLHGPQIGVQVKEYRGQQVSVIGAVGKPGMYQLTGPRTLVDLLSMAGGISEKAGSQVHLYRQSPQGRQSYVTDLTALARNPTLVNMPVQAGDVIDVPPAGMFFVEGAVGKPGTYPLNGAYTLTQALAVAGGTDQILASYSDISIFRRRIGSEPERIAVNLNQVLAGQAPDPPIEVEDTIVVPMSTVKYVIHHFIGRIGLATVRPF